ncbi:hypothetical protein SDC9_121424 [bioreactor metagenome]|uniref:Uncharacterized protein n=1 Tax=bioreactor metagenome TaxID=1076179 RepID=A0A645CBV8_9ZZZZ
MLWGDMALAMQNLLNLIEIRVYSENDKNVWDSFIDSAKNRHFFFKRDYMEYHSDRFQDSSLMIYASGKLAAVLPGNLNGETFYSHQGLTYGGILCGERMTTSLMVAIFEKLVDFLRSLGVRRMVYKDIPYIYYTRPAEEAAYALYLHKARLSRRELSSVIDMNSGLSYTKGKKYNISKARKYGLEIVESSDYEGFIGLLTEVLSDRHGATPVHTAEELKLLAGRFPNNIRLFTCLKDEEILAGVLVFENEFVAHTQYLANSDEGKSIGALDFTLDYLIKNIFNTKKHFSFGISTEDQGYTLNSGLVDSKEGFGARAILHDIYEMEL